MTAREIVKARSGDWCGSYGLVPGPGHSTKDRSLKVWQDGDRILVHSFSGDDWRDCRAHLSLDDDWQRDRPAAPATRRPGPCITKPPRRVLDLIRTAAPVELVPDAVDYLKSRKLWPLPPGCTLKAHSGAPYWDAGDPPILVGRFPALLAEVRDRDGELVTLHVTYLKDGRKLSDRAPRKMLSGTTGRVGCAVRLMPVDGPVLAIAEGIETALAFQHLHGLPTWAALNTSLLGAFEPPKGIERLVIAADNDRAGFTAAWKLRDRLDLDMELRLPRRGDWAEDLEGSR